MRVKKIVDRKRMYVLSHLSLSPPSSPSIPLYYPLPYKFFFLSPFAIRGTQKVALTKKPPSLRKDSDKERSQSTTPSIHIEDCADDSRENEDKQTESPNTTSDSVLPKP